jgi:hypothetical protein
MKASTTRVAEVNDAAVARYKEMRAALLDAHSVDRTECEIVITTQLGLLGHEGPFKLHAMRLFDQAVSRERLEQAIMAGLGVTLVIPQIAQILDWIAEADEQHRAARP